MEVSEMTEEVTCEMIQELEVPESPKPKKVAKQSHRRTTKTKNSTAHRVHEHALGDPEA